MSTLPKAGTLGNVKEFEWRSDGGGVIFKSQEILFLFNEEEFVCIYTGKHIFICQA